MSSQTENHETVTNFGSYLHDKLGSINGIQGADSILFKSILYVSFLDSLAACTYPNEKGNRTRFTKLIDEHSNWVDKDRISITHLARFANNGSNPIKNKIKNYVDPIVDLWMKTRRSEIIDIKEDPMVDSSLLTSFGCSVDHDIEQGITLEHFKHINLFYQMRNALVHQFQTRFVDLRSDEHTEPFYQVIQTCDQTNNLIPERIELVYPVGFLRDLTSTVLRSVTNHFLTKAVNPFPAFYAGDYWISALN